MSKEKKTLFIHQPQFKGGPKEMAKFIYGNLRFPAEALEAGVEGTVYVECGIDFKGNVVTTRVLSGLGHGCDEEACRVLMLLKFDVERNRGVHVLFHKKIKVQFTKPKAAAPRQSVPQQQMQVAYTLTPTAEPAPPADQKPAEVTYSYTISF